jgi:D-alanyl-D-alanine carboxypeptidase (penicillin-binding protein 5/6)
MTRFLSFLLLTVIFSAPALAEPLIQTSAKQAIVIDYDTGTVLLEKNADEQMPTSSMSKTMTVYAVFEALQRGDITLDTEFTVSENAWRMQGSKMFVELGKPIRVEDLLKGVIVQSGNDATIVLAEGLSGSENAFAATLNAKAKELGMNHSNFVNASGWPDPNHYSTARDLSILAKSLIATFPKYYPMYSEKEFTWHNITQHNRNPLLYKNIGADGIKTGHTEAAGYGLMGSGVLGNRRVILVVNGLTDEKERASEAAKLLDWALKNFDNRTLFKAGAPVESAKVVLGQKESVPAALQEDIIRTVPKAASGSFKATAHFKEPLVAPIARGAEIGKLVIEVPNMAPAEYKLFASEDVAELGFFVKTMTKAKYYLTGTL